MKGSSNYVLLEGEEEAGILAIKVK